jgi:hypothetical protein
MILHRMLGHRVTKRIDRQRNQFPYACHSCKRMVGWVR